MTDNAYDVMIVGTGPAGMTAALYGQRLGLKTVVFGDTPGGISFMIDNLANYPGFNEGISGTEFGVKLFQQATMEGAMSTMMRLNRLKRDGEAFTATDTNGLTYTAPCAIVATGRVPKRLPGEKAGMKGINFCSVCDGPLFRDKHATLAVVGSDNAAAQHATTLARIADKVFLICRSTSFKMDAAHEALVASQANIEILTRTEVTGYVGLDMMEGLSVTRSGGETAEIPVDAVFLAIGWVPSLKMLADPVETSDEGYLVTDASLMTSEPGLFAAGDVRVKHLYQVLTACSDGARAAHYVSRYLIGASK